MDLATNEILSLLTEDYYGLWEIAIQVPLDRHLLVAASNALLEQGLAEWFVRSSDSGEAVRWVASGGLMPDLNDEHIWSAPSLESPHLLLGITEAGKRAYFGPRKPPIG